jgi:hypothetical protein
MTNIVSLNKGSTSVLLIHCFIAALHFIKKLLSLLQAVNDVMVFCWQDMVYRRGYERVNLLSTDLTKETWQKLM